MGKRRKRIGLRAHIQSATNYLAKNLNRRSIRRFVTRTIREAQDGFSDAVGNAAPISRGAMSRARKLAAGSAGTAQVFGVSTTARTWSPITKNLAKKLLRMGDNVPPELQRAAQDAVDGVGDYKSEKQLQEILRGGLGIHHSGASALTRSVNRVRGSFNSLQRANILFSQASQGGLGGGVAAAGLVEMGLGKAENIVKSKFVEKIALGFANAIGANPTKFTKLIYAIGRGIRLGGAIGAVVQTGAAVAQEYTEQRQRSAGAQLSSFNSARAYGIDARLAQTIRGRTGSTISATLGGGLKHMLGFGADADEEKAARESNAFKQTAANREIAGRLGIDVAAVLASAAAVRGKSVEDLSEVEINRALDPVTNAAARNLVGHQTVENELNFGTRKGHKGQSFSRGALDNRVFDVLNDMTFGLLGNSNDKMREAEGEEIRNEFSQRIIESKKAEAGKVVTDNQRRNADIPPKMIRSTYQGQGGEIHMIPNPLYAQYLMERGQTLKQVRSFRMQEQATMKRKPVRWVD